MSASASFAARRSVEVRAGVRVEALTVAWMVVEAAIAIGVGVAAHSLLLTAFGVDSVIELVSGAVLLWRLTVEARSGDLERVERAERRAAWVGGGGLALLCLYVVAIAAWGLMTQHHPEPAPIGIGLAAAALVGMPLLARAKRRIAARIGSAALRGDAACSMTCAAMAGALLAGLALNAAAGWWWAEDLAALAFLYWLVPEARAALAGAHSGRGGCGCGGDDCPEST